LVSGEPFDPFDRLRAGRLRALCAVSRDYELINKKRRPQGQRLSEKGEKSETGKYRIGTWKGIREKSSLKVFPKLLWER
jgi:hypothetical protein